MSLGPPPSIPSEVVEYKAAELLASSSLSSLLLSLPSLSSSLSSSSLLSSSPSSSSCLINSSLVCLHQFFYSYTVNFTLQGVVCVLGEADDFGKLALMNDAPRSTYFN
jgi:hypothetical protein